MSKLLTYVEIDLDYCELLYGVAPCTAAVGVTGDRKCFNTLKTCQDRENFSNEPVTLRFAIDSGNLPADIDCIPSIKSVELSPAIISLGEDLGQRATLTVVFSDHRHTDVGPGFDKYVAERPYNPWSHGTFFSRFRARNPFVRGRAIRLIRGFLGEALVDMDTRHYIIDSFDGPDPQGGQYQLIAKDVLKLADEDRAQAPVLSNGSLAGSIDNAVTAASLSPTGIGDLEYPASGFVCFGGKEVCSFTRSGDSLTIVRGQLGTQAQQHNGGDRAQLVLRYPGDDVADVLYDLLVNYAAVPADYINLPEWQAETAANLSVLTAATITEPTSVRELASQLVEQSALAVWWNDRARKVRLQVLREIATNAAIFDASVIMEGTLRTKEQPTKRISQVWTYYGQRNPTQTVTDEDNYRAALATVDLERQGDYGSPAVRKIIGRFIPTLSSAERINGIQLSRFRDPPRSFSFSLFRDVAVELGGGYRLGWWSNVDDTGAEAYAPIQITRVKYNGDTIEVEAEEMLASGTVVVTQSVFLLTTGAVLQYEIPATWNSYENTVDVLAGGSGGANGSSNGGAGGAGGAFSRVSNLDYNPGQLISYRVGAGSNGGSGAAGEDSWFGAATFGSAVVGARGAAAASGRTGIGIGGQAASGIGDLRTSGGNGGTGASVGESRAGGGGGGAAAGPNGNGGNGGNGSGTSDDGGAGGGGADGGANGSDQGGGSSGYPGGGNRFGFGGGSLSFIDGQQGGGGRGGDASGTPGIGGDGEQIWTQTVSPIIAAGPGGGGGGGGSNREGGRGGFYGAGGGGGGRSDVGGNGTQGIIVISWREAE